jgi:hydroxymethylpyrimidine kinase/phosphomethylpyrimidine kinase
VPIPCALAIGGLDPGGGAGLAADLRAFHAAGAFGCAVIAVLTVQSTAGLRSARAMTAREVTAQAVEVFDHQRVRAVKLGALGSLENVRAVARLLDRNAKVPVVLDTPMRSTRSTRRQARLLAAGALSAIRDELLPRATLVTANVAEAEALLGERVRTVGEAHDAARELARGGARAVLVKGGHLDGPSAIDVLAIDGEVVELRARRLSVGPVHGTGCTFASLIAGRLALRETERIERDALVAAIRWAKRVHHAALSSAVGVGAGKRATMRVLAF